MWPTSSLSKRSVPTTPSASSRLLRIYAPRGAMPSVRLSPVVLPIVCPSSINLPVSLCSADVTPLQSSYGHSDLPRRSPGFVRGPLGEAASETNDRQTSDGVPCLMRLTFHTFRLQPPPAVSGEICFPPEPAICRLGIPVCRVRWYPGLRRYLAGSPQRQAESSSLSCGPYVHFQLLSTSSCKNAVTFC